MVEDGVRAKVKMIAGTVQSVETPLTASGRQSTFIITEYRLGTDIMKTARVDILSVRLEPSDLQDHQDLMLQMWVSLLWTPQTIASSRQPTILSGEILTMGCTE